MRQAKIISYQTIFIDYYFITKIHDVIFQERERGTDKLYPLSEALALKSKVISRVPL